MISSLTFQYFYFEAYIYFVILLTTCKVCLKLNGCLIYEIYRNYATHGIISR